jgi:glycosyltransferase involved in cell wall biosynthesis
MSRPGPLQRLRQTRRLLAREGASGVAARLLRRALGRLEPPGRGAIPVEREHLVRASRLVAEGPPAHRPRPWTPGEPLEVAWITGPPGEGSGGHTTMFRIVARLERHGHRCTVYVYDLHGWELDQHRRTVAEWWPWVRAEVRDLAAGIADAHAVVATSWPTAYPALASPAAGRRFYFVQDLEPVFYPAGSLALLAEATYRFGFHGITAGRWLAERLWADYGMTADHFDFGCELEIYAAGEAGGEREGVCFYSRPSTPRRAHELAVLALELFAERNPEVPIHAFGEPAGPLPFRYTDHGLLRPSELAALYRSCAGGLVLSATNVSLVPYEMLAAGCVPVVNDAEHNRVVLANDCVAYAPAQPAALAQALERLVRRPPAQRAAAAARAAASVRSASWEEAATQVERALAREVARAGAGELAA